MLFSSGLVRIKQVLVFGMIVFDFHEEGIAHYGLFPEWVNTLQQVSKVSNNDTFEMLMNSAEA